MLQWIRNNVRIKGGGNVQTAFGRSLVVSIAAVMGVSQASVSNYLLGRN